MRNPVAICSGAVPTMAGPNGTAKPASAAGRQLSDPATSGGGLPSPISIECSIEGTVKSGLFAGANVSASLTVSAESVALCKAGKETASADLTGSIKVASD